MFADSAPIDQGAEGMFISVECADNGLTKADAKTIENPPQKDKKWGVISGQFSRSNGAGNPAAVARSIRPGFGANLTPKPALPVAWAKSF